MNASWTDAQRLKFGLVADVLTISLAAGEVLGLEHPTKPTTMVLPSITTAVRLILIACSLSIYIDGDVTNSYGS